MKNLELTLLFIYIVSATFGILFGLYNLFSQKIPNISIKLQSANAIEYDMSKHRAWGNRISWDDKGESIYGHLSRRPNVGDFIIQKENNETTFVYQVINVKKEIDPPDMFFAKVKFYGIKENLPNYNPINLYNKQEKGFIV